MSRGGGRERLTKDELCAALSSFAALAAAYADAPDGEIGDDKEADAALRAMTELALGFVEKRVTAAHARALAAATAGLRNVYARLQTKATGDIERDGPSSRKTWHEGAWHTDEERRAVVGRLLSRWFPGTAASAIADADLSVAQIEAHGGAREAAETIVGAIAAAQGRDENLLSNDEGAGEDLGRHVFGVPLTRERALAFATEALALTEREG